MSVFEYCLIAAVLFAVILAILIARSLHRIFAAEHRSWKAIRGELLMGLIIYSICLVLGLLLSKLVPT
jgi:hypothetical protein